MQYIRELPFTQQMQYVQYGTPLPTTIKDQVQDKEIHQNSSKIHQNALELAQDAETLEEIAGLVSSNHADIQKIVEIFTRLQKEANNKLAEINERLEKLELQVYAFPRAEASLHCVDFI